MERVDLASFSFLILEEHRWQTEKNDEREFHTVRFFWLTECKCCHSTFSSCNFFSEHELQWVILFDMYYGLSLPAAQPGERLSLTHIHTAAELIRTLSHYNHFHLIHRKKSSPRKSIHYWAAWCVHVPCEDQQELLTSLPWRPSYFQSPRCCAANETDLQCGGMSVCLDGYPVLFVCYLTCCGDPCLHDLQPGGREQGCELLVCLDQYRRLIYNSTGATVKWAAILLSSVICSLAFKGWFVFCRDFECFYWAPGTI